MKAGQSGRCSDREFAFVSKSLLVIAAGLGLASPSSDQEFISVVGSSIGYLLEKSAR